jgi:predicted nucleotidyltransferase
VIERFVVACAADARVAAAFLTGSYAAGTVDAHSDLDLGVITADAAYEDFVSSRDSFVRLLGEPVFVETFAQPDPLFFILADGTEGELVVGRESAYREVASGPHRVLLDKAGVLEGAAFVGRHPDEDEQQEALRRLVVWFWHDLSHFVTAFAREQWWWAYGELETLRRSCVGLIRLRRDFADAAAAPECYFKVDTALPAADLEPVRQTLCSTEPAELLGAARAILRLYQQLAPPLAQAHGIRYPATLARHIQERLARLAPDARPN